MYVGMYKGIYVNMHMRTLSTVHKPHSTDAQLSPHSSLCLLAQICRRAAGGVEAPAGPRRPYPIGRAFEPRSEFLLLNCPPRCVSAGEREKERGPQQPNQERVGEREEEGGMSSVHMYLRYRREPGPVTGECFHPNTRSLWNWKLGPALTKSWADESLHWPASSGRLRC